MVTNACVHLVTREQIAMVCTLTKLEIAQELCFSKAMKTRKKWAPVQAGHHYSERTAPIQTLCHGIFTDQSIFRYAWEYYFPRKFKFWFTWELHKA